MIGDQLYADHWQLLFTRYSTAIWETAESVLQLNSRQQNQSRKWRHAYGAIDGGTKSLPTIFNSPAISREKYRYAVQH